MATASLAAPQQSVSRPRQNWILGPVQDVVLFIATPLLSLAVVIAVYPVLGLPTLYLLFTIYTVGHHLPTFMRIYGDRDLFRRFRWRFIIGPVIPFAFAAGVAAYVVLQDIPLEKTFYLMIIPTIWDAWHFLMQHYGFVRIYDRPNAAPRRLAARMDLAICWTWFLLIMVRAGSWLPDILADIDLRSAIPVIYLVDSSAYRILLNVTGAAALAVTVAYAAYLVWCRAQGYFISRAKLLLLAITFGVMYLTYVPNTVMDHVLHGWHSFFGYVSSEQLASAQGDALRWNFLLGFVVLGLVHDTQYLAIVWKYNRSLARREDPTRPPLFQKAFARGGAVAILAYVILCFAYGGALHLDSFLSLPTGIFKVLFAVLFALSFTSLLMHYYFDGFIWKVRHKENQQHLAMLELRTDTVNKPEALPSWWDRWRERSSLPWLKTALSHTLYFGLPLGLLTLGAWWWNPDPEGQVALRRAEANRLYQRDRIDDAIRQAQRAVDALEEQVPVQRQLVDISPTAANSAHLAFLLHQQAGARLDLAYLKQEGTEEERKERYHEGVRQAIATLEAALQRPGPCYNNPLSLGAPPPDPQVLLAQWHQELDR